MARFYAASHNSEKAKFKTSTGSHDCGIGSIPAPCKATSEAAVSLPIYGRTGDAPELGKLDIHINERVVLELLIA